MSMFDYFAMAFFAGSILFLTWRVAKIENKLRGPR
jgi:hypothetical protein